jgi:hypothetical protein
VWFGKLFLQLRGKLAVATTLAHAKGGQFFTHMKALAGNPHNWGARKRSTKNRHLNHKLSKRIAAARYILTLKSEQSDSNVQRLSLFATGFCAQSC